MLFVSVWFVCEPDYCIIVSPLEKPRCFWGKQWGICLNKKKKFVWVACRILSLSSLLCTHIFICDEEPRTVVHEKILHLFLRVLVLVFCTALGILIISEIMKDLDKKKQDFKIASTLWKAVTRALNKFYSSLCLLTVTDFSDLRYANS